MVVVVLQALSLIESEDIVQEERSRKAAVRKSKMDADLDAESADLQEKKGVSYGQPIINPLPQLGFCTGDPLP